MITQNQTFIRDTGNFPILAGEKFTDGGIVAVFSREAGEKTGVKLSRGAAGEVFAGVTLTRSVPPRVLHNVIEDVIPPKLSVDMQRFPINGQHLVSIEGTVADLVADKADLVAGKVLVEGDVLTFHVDDAGKEFLTQFAYEPTLMEAMEVLGCEPLGGLSEPVTNQVTLITNGEVGTSFFDASCDWSDPTAIHPKLGADGLFTLNGSGEELKNVIILEAPTSENASLLVDIR